jgi:hypothetical protein
MRRRLLTLLVATLVAPLCGVTLVLTSVGIGSSAAGAATGGKGVAASHRSGGTGATVGSPRQPQPSSKADFSGHGANKSGPYDSTRNGSPSLNGNGNGNGRALGKPCAGCVGKADNKNPKGQMPNGSDPNAGYECDRNHGIGRTNPAHTGCTTAQTTPTTTPTTATTTPTTATTTPTAPTSPTTAPTTPTSSTTPAVTGLTSVSTGGSPTGGLTSAGQGSGDNVVAAATPATANGTGSGRLAFTGADTAALLIAGLISLLAGSVIVGYSRRRRTATPD